MSVNELLFTPATGSLNVAVTLVEIATFAAPAGGVLAVTIGGVLSTGGLPSVIALCR